MKNFDTIWNSFKELYKQDPENNSCSPFVQHLKTSLILFAEQNKISTRDQMESELDSIDNQFSVAFLSHDNSIF